MHWNVSDVSNYGDSNSFLGRYHSVIYLKIPYIFRWRYIYIFQTFKLLKVGDFYCVLRQPSFSNKCFKDNFLSLYTKRKHLS